MSDLLALNRGDVDLWYVRTEDAKQQKWLAQHLGLLSDDERERQQRFVFEKDRDQFLIAHALVRNKLSRYLAVQPDAWRFQTNKFGKPEIDPSQNASRVRFNLSHCDELVLFGVTVGCDIGVDCENVNRKVDIEQLAPRVFSSSEREYLKSVSVAVQTETFFRLWTLKEAYIKARGVGMSLPLKKISFDIAAAPRINVSFEPEIDDRPDAWQFVQPQFSGPFVAAVAVNMPRDEELRVEIHEATETGKCQ